MIMPSLRNPISVESVEHISTDHLHVQHPCHEFIYIYMYVYTVRQVFQSIGAFGHVKSTFACAFLFRFLRASIPDPTYEERAQKA